jgi:hypothetical protein
MSKAMNDAMVWHWQRGRGKFGDDAVHPMYAEAFKLAWETCRETCVVAVCAEHVGHDLDDPSLGIEDTGYNNALKHARDAIRVA